MVVKNWKTFFLFASIILLCFISCLKPTEDKLIRQSNFVREDQTNGRIAGNSNIIESTNFYYNKDGNVERITVYSDTTPQAILLKELNMTYLNNRVLIRAYLDTIGTINYVVNFNDKKQVTSVLLPDSSGLFISYFDDKISSVYDSPNQIDYINFMYDSNNNLLQYERKENNAISGKAILEYSNEPINAEFDSKFLSKEIKFIYVGGLDFLTKLGLNTGLSAQNKLIKRTEIILPSYQIYETYDYGYTYNSDGKVIKRNIRWSTDTLFYQFKY
ncbi:MAG: hypothetical protein R2739_01920 [Chitinophagales bacterium]|nr:hypothetical protein [Bacteroidota bacterium]